MYETGPLTVLARKLTVGPPSVARLMGILEQLDGLQEFIDLVREFLPDREMAIMANPPTQQVEAFIQLFSERYFPLHDLSAMWMDEGEEGYYELISYIPVPRLGVSFDDYHELDGAESGIQLLTALVASPYDDGTDGARVPLLEQCAGAVGEELIRRLPKDGWPPETLHLLLDDTRFEGVALWADVLWRQADSVFFNVSWEDDVTDADWSRETVDYLTQEWPKARAIREKVDTLATWLEDAPRDHFRELIEAIMLREDTREDTRHPKTLVEIFGGEEDDNEAQVRIRV